MKRLTKKQVMHATQLFKGVPSKTLRTYKKYYTPLGKRMIDATIRKRPKRRKK